jgi:D-glycero-D-manno-heptose 1,7-bisphosphate phosphatase
MGVGPLRRAVFLDRDGVLNEPVVRDGKPYPPASAGEVRMVEGAAEALESLRQSGYLLIVVTNQPDVARGAATREAVDAIHARLADSLPVDEFVVCWHDDADGCACRKPAPGMLLDAARRHGIDLAASYMVGDRWRDIEAGAAAGCCTILIDRGYRERRSSIPPTAKVYTLGEAAAYIRERGSCVSPRKGP